MIPNSIPERRRLLAHCLRIIRRYPSIRRCFRPQWLELHKTEFLQQSANGIGLHLLYLLPALWPAKHVEALGRIDRTIAFLKGKCDRQAHNDFVCRLLGNADGCNSAVEEAFLLDGLRQFFSDSALKPYPKLPTGKRPDFGIRFGPDNPALLLEHTSEFATRRETGKGNVLDAAHATRLRNAISAKVNQVGPGAPLFFIWSDHRFCPSVDHLYRVIRERMSYGSENPKLADRYRGLIGVALIRRWKLDMFKVSLPRARAFGFKEEDMYHVVTALEKGFFDTEFLPML